MSPSDAPLTGPERPVGASGAGDVPHSSPAPAMKPSTRRVLNALKWGWAHADGDGWVRGNDLLQPDVGGERFGARLYELRHEYGYVIEKRHDPTSALPQYRLLREEEAA